MNATITAVLALGIIGYLAWGNFDLRGDLKRAEVEIMDLQETVALKEGEKRKLKRDTDRAIKKLETEIKHRDEKGYSVEGLAAKQAEVDELEAKIEQAMEVMGKQKERVNGLQAELRKAQAMLAGPR